MNRKALLALCLAILVPLISYLFVKYASEEAIDMPKHYLPDSVVTRVVDGRRTTDTAWHTVANIRLQNQLGDTVNLYDIQNKPIVADFFFTHCAGICPRLTASMVKLQRSFMKGGDEYHKIDTSVVQFVSFSIDPERDTVQRLKDYADRFGVNHDNWWFLTGNRDSVYNFIFEQLHVDKYAEGPIDSNFVHTNRFVLIDKTFKVRGYYDGLDSASLGKLAQDVALLMVEKATNPEPLPFDPALMAIFFSLQLLLLLLSFAYYLKRNQLLPIMLQPAFLKNDPKAKWLIGIFSFVVFAAVVLLGNVHFNIAVPFNVHIFAALNALLNTIIAVLLVAALVAVRKQKWRLHKQLMIAALVLSILFLVSYIAHHLLAGEAHFGDADHDGVTSSKEAVAVGSIRYVYFFILATHIILATCTLPFILYTAYKGLTSEFAQHKKLSKIIWPLWLYVAVTGPIVYFMIQPYYR